MSAVDVPSLPVNVLRMTITVLRTRRSLLISLAFAWLSACSTISDRQPLQASGVRTQPYQIGHVALSVKDVERSAQWYAEVFGFVQLGPVYDIQPDESPLGQVAARLFSPPPARLRVAQLATESGMAIELFELAGNDGAAKRGAYPATGIIHFAIVVDAFDETLRKLDKAGGTLIVRNLANPTRSVAFYHDPDQNIIEISSRKWDGM
ncbi:MAG: VOC family protein [Candidatus Accumulibacter sp. UW26]|jgi:catechol 2,3-dioxygenase-like lactoylglutathione lyase family enzyme